jgi:hypothetical protein
MCGKTNDLRSGAVGTDEEPIFAATLRHDVAEPTLVGWEVAEQVSTEPVVLLVEFGPPPRPGARGGVDGT